MNLIQQIQRENLRLKCEVAKLMSDGQRLREEVGRLREQSRTSDHPDTIVCPQCEGTGDGESYAVNVGCRMCGDTGRIPKPEEDPNARSDD